MRITGRDLRKIINEELSRANKHIAIREGVDLDGLRYNSEDQIVDEKGRRTLLDPMYAPEINAGFIDCADMLQDLLAAGIITEKARRTFDEMRGGHRPRTAMAIRDAFRSKLGAAGEVLAFLHMLDQDMRLDSSDMPGIKDVIGNVDNLGRSVRQFIDGVAVGTQT